jgi:transcriptional regulator with XRE-family HTH domain
VSTRRDIPRPQAVKTLLVPDYGRRIRAARAYAGLTQDQLAEALGLDVQTVKRRESGKQEPRNGERIAIAAVCNVPLEFIEHGFPAVVSTEAQDALTRIEQTLADHDQFTRTFAEQRIQARFDSLTSELRAALREQAGATLDEALARAQALNTPPADKRSENSEAEEDARDA